MSPRKRRDKPYVILHRTRKDWFDARIAEFRARQENPVDRYEIDTRTGSVDAVVPTASMIERIRLHLEQDERHFREEHSLEWRPLRFGRYVSPDARAKAFKALERRGWGINREAYEYRWNDDPEDARR